MMKGRTEENKGKKHIHMILYRTGSD